MGLRLVGSFILLSTSVVTAATTVGTGPVAGGITTFRDVGQTFRTPAGADRSLDAFTVRANAEDFVTGLQNVSATLRLAVFRFNGSSVVGDPLYTSEPYFLSAGPRRYVTFNPHLPLEPDTTYLAVVDKWTATPSQSVGLTLWANTINGASDVYLPGHLRTPSGAAFPYTGVTWAMSGTHGGTSDIYFEAVFNVPEPASCLVIGVSSLAVGRRRRV